MKATELRIGNFVWQQENLPPVVMEIQPYMFEYVNEKGELNLPILPIILTEEWLQKFGFFEDTYTTKRTVNGFDIYIRKSNGQFHGADFHHSDLKVRELKYVHQLQNLYFDLMAEELSIKQ